jgi:hypothetical protein
MIDTNDPPKAATTSHHKNKCLDRNRGQHKHPCQAALPSKVVLQMQWAAANQY